MEREIRENGASVTVSRGERVVLVLPENGSTGYQWSVAEITGPLVVESNSFVPPQSTTPGADGERRVVLSAEGDGRGSVRLALRPAWEPQAEPTERFSVDLAVE